MTSVCSCCRDRRVAAESRCSTPRVDSFWVVSSSCSDMPPGRRRTRLTTFLVRPLSSARSSELIHTDRISSAVLYEMGLHRTSLEKRTDRWDERDRDGRDSRDERDREDELEDFWLLLFALFCVLLVMDRRRLLLPMAPSLIPMSPIARVKVSAAAAALADIFSCGSDVLLEFQWRAARCPLDLTKLTTMQGKSFNASASYIRRDA
mmetsp:Transcript_14192/g.40741  ORF Transcript_14192/g.40741 Transcript_14192/m.40741 type:complete len:206 (+) Transcript_14192:2625-3242(+)